MKTDKELLIEYLKANGEKVTREYPKSIRHNTRIITTNERITGYIINNDNSFYDKLLVTVDGNIFYQNNQVKLYDDLSVDTDLHRSKYLQKLLQDLIAKYKLWNTLEHEVKINQDFKKEKRIKI